MKDVIIGILGIVIILGLIIYAGIWYADKKI